MASLATLDTGNRRVPVNDRDTITSDEAWAAFERRDRSWDGRLVGGVKTTGIYCRPSCPARRPKRENVDFFPDGASARAAGFRPCLRCEPDDVNREETALKKAFALLTAAEEAPSLEDLAAAVGYSPHHFHRLFKRATGVTPAAYSRSLRARRAETALSENERITDAIYDAGYSGPARFYADAKGRLGMTPSAWRDGGRGETISWATAETDLGTMLVAMASASIGAFASPGTSIQPIASHGC